MHRLSALLGFVALGERLSGQVILGIALTVCGVVLAILFGKRRDQLHAWEAVKGPLWIGIVFGLGAAAGQAVGSVVAKPVMASGIDPFLASMVRVGVAVFCLSVLIALPIQGVKPKTPLTLKARELWRCSQASWGLAYGMTLLLFALSGGNVGVVSTLSATSPVIILPMLWLKTGERPAGGAWVGRCAGRHRHGIHLPALMVAGFVEVCWCSPLMPSLSLTGAYPMISLPRDRMDQLVKRFDMLEAQMAAGPMPKPMSSSRRNIPNCRISPARSGTCSGPKAS